MFNARVMSLYQHAARLRREGPLAYTLVVVTRAAGHTPQVLGATMLIARDGSVLGTVGGGRFEHEIIRLGRDCRAPLRKTLHLAAELGMCCGGVMDVLISPLTRADAWLDGLDADRTAWLRTSLADATLGQRSLHEQGPPLEGTRRFEHAAVVAADQALWERLDPHPRLLVFGAGHVSGPTAAIGLTLGYDVWVIDDRPDWNTAERFAEPCRRVLEPFEDFLDRIQPRSSDAALIITRGHDFDHLILDTLIEHELAYLGMIGSKSKVHKSLQKLRARGVSDERLDRLHAPIGLDIGALTPEEIAVSIAAQLVATRRASRVGESQPARARLLGVVR